MIDSEMLEKDLHMYLQRCLSQNIEPSFNGAAKWLKIGDWTIRRVVKGEYRPGKPYTKVPNVRRQISNEDFEMVRNIFMSYRK